MHCRERHRHRHCPRAARSDLRAVRAGGQLRHPSLLATEWDVRTAGDGVEGLAAARRLRPDLILSDLMMPRMSGTELCAAVKADPELRQAPFVLLTARSDLQARLGTFDLGADDY